MEAVGLISGKSLTVLAGFGLVGVVTVVSLSLGGAVGSPAHSRPGPGQHLAAQVSPRLIAHFTVFRRALAAGVSDAPAEMVLNPHAVRFLRLNLSGTQLVRTGSGPVWVVPGRDGACVISGQATATNAPQAGQNYTGCDTTDGILQNGLMYRGNRVDGPSVSSILFGLVPDGNTTVTLTLATGARQHVSVIDNVVRATLPTGPVTVAFRNAAGASWSHTYPGPQRHHSRIGG
jgi:hypothetical protein